jgi:two-component system, NtrC family, sensor kinase
MTQERWLLAAMLASVCIVGVTMLIDERRVFEEALETLRDEQVTLSTAVAADFESRLAQLERARTPSSVKEEFQKLIPSLLGGAMELEHPGSRIFMVARPEQGHLLTTRGGVRKSKALLDALRAGRSSTMLSREEAASLGLQQRIAVAGLHAVDSNMGPTSIVVVASAQRLRAREHYAQLRFLLGLTVVTALVMGFGGAALRQQRHRLEVARALEISALQRERERLLVQADKMATLAALSSGIAHQVATPLGTIMARIEQVLPNVADDPRAHGALDVALQQVKRIQDVINSVLGMARGDLPALVQERPEEIARASVDLVQHRFAQAGVSIQLDVARELPRIACDPPMLEQALTNLLLNACDASPRGSTIELRLTCEAGKIFFCVEDEGEGISDETARRACAPFFTTKAKGRGTGLGLAITNEVVSHHRGKLIVKRRERGRGTRAVIELPQI